MTLDDRLLHLFEQNGQLSTEFIRSQLGCMNSANVVMRLRKRGHLIKTRLVGVYRTAIYTYIRGPQNV